MLYALVLASAFLHAAWNALLKRTPDPRGAVHPVVAVSGAIAAALAALALAAGRAPLDARALAWSAGAGLFESRYFHALGGALAAGPLGPVYTLSRGAAALLIWPLSMALLGEPLTGTGAAGSALVLLGLAGAGLERGMTGLAARKALECALLITGYHFAYKLALANGSEPAAVFAVSMGVATALNLALGGPAYRRTFAGALRATPWRIGLAGAVCAASFLFFMVALARGGAAYVFTLRNSSVLFATALAAALGERPTRRQIAGAALVCAGAVLLGLER